MKTEVTLVEASKLELNPDKKYLIIFNKNTLSMDQMERLNEGLTNEGFGNILVSINGDPKDVKIVESE